MCAFSFQATQSELTVPNPTETKQPARSTCLSLSCGPFVHHQPASFSWIRLCLPVYWEPHFWLWCSLFPFAFSLSIFLLPVHTLNLACPILSTHIYLASQDDTEGRTSGFLPILVEARRTQFRHFFLFCIQTENNTCLRTQRDRQHGLQAGEIRRDSTDYTQVECGTLGPRSCGLNRILM